MPVKAMPWIRRIWFRLLIVAIAMVGIDLLVLPTGDISPYRKGILDTLVATSLIFAITASLILAIINNYVKGLRDQFMEQTRRVRRLAWECNDYFSITDKHEFQDVFKNHVSPLLEKSLREWAQIENIQNWGKGIEEQLNKLLKIEKVSSKLYELIYKYLLPIEDEINELGLLYIKRISSELHAKIATGVFYLITFAVVAITLGRVLPSTYTVDLAILNVSTAVITYSVLELLFVLSFVLQQIKEETFTE